MGLASFITYGKLPKLIEISNNTKKKKKGIFLGKFAQKKYSKIEFLLFQNRVYEQN